MAKNIRRESLVVKVNKKWLESYNKATDEFNSKIEAINKKFGEEGHTENPKYVKAVGKLWKDSYSKQLISEFGVDPVSGTKDWVQDAPFINVYDDFIDD